jgi:hypothetical protein
VVQARGSEDANDSRQRRFGEGIDEASARERLSAME